MVLGCSGTICRMQHNAGDFVRDLAADGNEGYQKGSGILPRIFDLPILLGTLLLTMLVNPAVFVVGILIPVTATVSLFFGAGLRRFMCSNEVNFSEAFQIWTPLKFLAKFCLGLSVLTSCAFFLSHVLPCCKRPSKKTGLKRPPATPGFLVGHAAGGFLLRLSLSILVIMIFICAVPVLQLAPYWMRNKLGEVGKNCYKYKELQISQASRRCTDIYNGSVWYEDPTLTFRSNVTNQVDTIKEEYHVLKQGMHLLLQALLGMLACSFCFMPMIGTSVFMNLLQAAGPILLLGVACAFSQFSVYGPIMSLNLLSLKYEEDAWAKFVSRSLLLAMVIVPFYEELRALLHNYYRRSLYQNFFLNGEDCYFRQVAQSPYCPFVILTGTSSDFQPPGDEDTISELSFTALHTGGEETGYIETPFWRTLSKCTALTGAGCLDAISLSMSQALSMRFWLEVLNLSWGDYILFESRPIRCFDKISGYAGRNAGHVNRFLHRLPCSLSCLALLFLVYLAWEEAHTPDLTLANCARARGWLKLAISGLVILFALGFFSYTPGLSLFAFNSVVRQFQQLTQFYFVGKVPPRMLYVTDGGVRDCTAVGQLLRRRSRRILLVLAAADPRDELGVLKTALEVAREDRLASFFDPDDPRRDLQASFELFKARKDAPYLHIGICYCWNEDGDVDSEPVTGHLYIVKNRLPPEFEGRSLAPLLSEEEVTDTPGGWCGQDEDGFGELAADELGPFGCCDCCHQRGLNCGPKWPHGGFTGYLYLTPQWFNSLSRLGFEVSGKAVATISSSLDIAETGDIANLPPLRPYTPMQAQPSGGFCCPAADGGPESDDESASSDGS